MLFITINDTLMWEKIQGGGVKFMIFWTVHLKTLVFERPEHLKNSSKILVNTLFNSLANLKKKIPDFLYTNIPGSLPIPITPRSLRVCPAAASSCIDDDCFYYFQK